MKIIGVSRDPMKSHEKFIGKYGLAVALASDQDGRISDAFGTWVEKSMYGRKYMGMERATHHRNRRQSAEGVAQGEGAEARPRSTEGGDGRRLTRQRLEDQRPVDNVIVHRADGMRSSRPCARSSIGDMPQWPSMS